VLLAAATFLITFWDNRRSGAHRAPYAPEVMMLTEPRGRVDRDLTFRWGRVDTAASYIVLVTSVDHKEVEILRPVHDTYLKPSDTEVADLNPGSYTWTVEARSDKGQLIGYGEGSFTIPIDESCRRLRALWPRRILPVEAFVFVVRERDRPPLDPFPFDLRGDFQRIAVGQMSEADLPVSIDPR
jgi:hypothetical protein